MATNSLAPQLKLKAEENKVSKRLETVLEKHNEILELMKKSTINSAISSIEELCFQFKLAVETESVNLPLFYSFIRHVDVLISCCEKKQQTPFLTCFAYLYECFRMITPELYFDRPTEDLNAFILNSHPVFEKTSSEMFTYNSSEYLHKPFIDQFNKIKVHPHKKFYYEYLKRLGQELNKLLIARGMQFQLSFCFVPENRFNIVLCDDKVRQLCDFLISAGYIDSSENNKHNFWLLFNNTSILKQPQSIVWIKKTSKTNKPSNISLRTFFVVLGNVINKELLSHEHRLYWESIFCTETKDTFSLADKGKELDSILKEAIENILK